MSSLKLPRENKHTVPGSNSPIYTSLLDSGELELRAKRAVDALQDCRLCPRNCSVDRLGGKRGICDIGRNARIASYTPHLGEERCISGTQGSGAIFFSMCSLHCVFCQNYEISQRHGGIKVSGKELAGKMLELQALGCHNINLVTPTHVVPQLLEAIFQAARQSLAIPIVYNSSGYDCVETLALLDGVVDIYMPDFKAWRPGNALRYLKAADYGMAAQRAILEMHKQVGRLQLDENGLAVRGLLVRHLLLPGGIEDTREILQFLAAEVSKDCCVNLMAQYTPNNKVCPVAYPEIDRRISPEVHNDAIEIARDLGLRIEGF